MNKHILAWSKLLCVGDKNDSEKRARIEEYVREQDEEYVILLENRIHLQHAASSLRNVMPGFGIEKDELVALTKPLAEKIQQLLEDAANE